MFMKKRSLIILFGLNISCCMLMMAAGLFPITFWREQWPLFVSVLVHWIFFTPFQFFLWFINLRNWLILYKYKWNHYSIELEWQSIINPKVKKDKNWFLENEKKYGDFNYMLRIFAICVISGLIIGYISIFFTVQDTYHDKHSNQAKIGVMFLLIIQIIPIILYVVIVCKTPSFDDYYYVHWESRMQSRILSLLILSLAIGVMIRNFTNADEITFIAPPIFSFAFFGVNYVSTFALISKNMKSLTLTTITSDLKSAAKEITLEQILSNKLSLDEFVSHLFTEYVYLYISNSHLNYSCNSDL